MARVPADGGPAEECVRMLKEVVGRMLEAPTIHGSRLERAEVAPWSNSALRAASEEVPVLGNVMGVIDEISDRFANFYDDTEILNEPHPVVRKASEEEPTFSHLLGEMKHSALELKGSLVGVGARKKYQGAAIRPAL